MRKIYVKPDIRVVRLKPQYILSTSETLGTTEERDNVVVGAREDEFEEDELIMHN